MPFSALDNTQILVNYLKPSLAGKIFDAMISPILLYNWVKFGMVMLNLISKLVDGSQNERKQHYNNNMQQSKPYYKPQDNVYRTVSLQNCM